MSTQSQRQRYRIGYALSPKKEQSLIQPSLVTKATERGIDLIRIDPNKSLIEQAPFDCVIHKLYGIDWAQQLRQFSSQNPNVPIIDSPESIARVHNRVSMLDMATELKIDFENEKFSVPNQVVVTKTDILTGDNAIEEMKLRFPVIAKPLLADGSDDSHKMYLIFDNEGLKSLTTPIVLQEFVNHGGVVFKVYVAGLNVKCVKRKSLPDISEEKMKTLKGSLPFSRISNLIDNDKKNETDNCSYEIDLEKVEMPSESFVMESARAMREALGLNLFNYDVIRDATNGNRYLVIDINYFPGYAKLPGYELILTDFFLDLVNKKSAPGVTGGDE
ncbi:Inositol-tetrakisphosphate 1-kinase [Melia azedarach]|uniref:Inositol-tetrakisphosphate 1-kinase n=1 Tax=Melia azedarach TaxID=155640 RepID=A0ACC1YCL7_MELAZ|nr:Inositol-tetrakisphosphate 1-kinase [Melia azedarach]